MVRASGPPGGTPLRSALCEWIGMISGIVSELLDATVPLSMRSDDGQLLQIEAVVDTGFSGDLTLRPSLIGSLGLQWLCRQQGVLADGQLHTFDVYAATVV